MTRQFCALCDLDIKRENDSREHIIPNSIGGRKRVRGFLCTLCNRTAGGKWDAAVADQLNFLALHFTGRRHRGEVRPGDYRTLSGMRVRLHPDGHLTFPPSAPNVTNRGSHVEIRARATTREQVRAQLQGLKRRYPKLDIEEAMLSVVEQQDYLPEMVGTVCNFGGPESGRSVVKTAFALAVASGVVAQTCNQARSYLKLEGGEPCFGYYYERDFVKKRPADRVFHCVAVKGDPQAGRLFGYVELFSAYRMLVGLADQYRGEPLFNSYTIDPCNGEELNLEFDLSLTDDELLRGISNEYEYSAGMMAAFQSVAAIAQARSFAREQRRVTNAAWAGALSKLGLFPGQRMTPEIAMALAREIVSRMQPFLSHFVTANRPCRVVTETPLGNRPGDCT